MFLKPIRGEWAVNKEMYKRGIELEDLEMQARNAYFRAEGKDAQQPNEGMSGTVEHNGNNYVRLANSNGTLAVYEVNGNRLKRLKQWPEALEAA